MITSDIIIALIEKKHVQYKGDKDWITCDNTKPIPAALLLKEWRIAPQVTTHLRTGYVYPSCAGNNEISTLLFPTKDDDTMVSATLFWEIEHDS